MDVAGSPNSRPATPAATLYAVDEAVAALDGMAECDPWSLDGMADFDPWSLAGEGVRPPALGDKARAAPPNQRASSGPPARTDRTDRRTA